MSLFLQCTTDTPFSSTLTCYQFGNPRPLIFPVERLHRRLKNRLQPSSLPSFCSTSYPVLQRPFSLTNTFLGRHPHTTIVVRLKCPDTLLRTPNYVQSQRSGGDLPRSTYDSDPSPVPVSCGRNIDKEGPHLTEAYQSFHVGTGLS